MGFVDRAFDQHEWPASDIQELLSKGEQIERREIYGRVLEFLEYVRTTPEIYTIRDYPGANNKTA